jgi:predicted Zn-dependent peptidase
MKLARQKLTRSTAPRIGEECFHATLPGGLTLIHAPRRGLKKKFAVFTTRYGSIDSAWRNRDGSVHRVPDGIAHFLEHQLFKKADGDLTEKFTANGAESNAHTTHSGTSFYFEGVSHFRDNLELLLRMCLTPHFEKSLVDTERGIITQEIVSYRDKPNWISFQMTMEALYAKHPVRIDIAGNEHTVAKITPEMLAECHRRFYHPSNCSLVVAGDLEAAEVADMAGDMVTRLFDGRTEEPHAPVPIDEPAAAATPRAERAMHTTLPRLMVGYKLRNTPPAGKAFLASEYLHDAMLDLTFGRGTAFFEQLYRDGVVSGDFAAGAQIEPGFGYVMIGGETSNPGELESRIDRRIAEVTDKGFEAAEVTRKQRKYEGDFIRGFEGTEETAFAHAGAWRHDYGAFDAVDLIPGLTPETLLASARDTFRADARTVSLLRKPARTGATATSTRRKSK